MNLRLMGRLAFAGLVGSLAALACSAPAEAAFTIERGWDLFQTSPDTTFAGAQFQGVPLGTFDFTTGTDGDFGRGIGVRSVGNADTIVKRLDVVSVTGPGMSGTTRIELEALNLRTINPTNFGLGTGIYYETLQSQRSAAEGGPGPLSQGTLTITFGPEGDPHGTWTSTLNVFFDLRLGSPTGPIAQKLSETIMNDPGQWGHNPPPGAVQIPGVNVFLRAPNDRSNDFWPRGVDGSPIIIDRGTDLMTIRHVFTTATVPEPSGLILLGTGAIGLLGICWRRRTA